MGKPTRLKLTEREFARMGFARDARWRISDINKDFELCNTYPRYLILPACFNEKDLEQVAKFRYFGRVPTVVWRHATNGCIILRTSQPAVGIFGWFRCEQDENLLSCYIENSTPADPAPPDANSIHGHDEHSSTVSLNGRDLDDKDSSVSKNNHAPSQANKRAQANFLSETLSKSTDSITDDMPRASRLAYLDNDDDDDDYDDEDDEEDDDEDEDEDESTLDEALPGEDSEITTPTNENVNFEMAPVIPPSLLCDRLKSEKLLSDGCSQNDGRNGHTSVDLQNLERASMTRDTTKTHTTNNIGKIDNNSLENGAKTQSSASNHSVSLDNQSDNLQESVESQASTQSTETSQLSFFSSSTSLSTTPAPDLKMVIIDARGYSAALVNRAKGGGCEHVSHYPKCEIQFMSLANIHSIRRSYQSIESGCATYCEQSNK